jgi:hypothetical protein
MDFAARLRFANRATRQVFSRYVCVRHFAASTAAAMRCACGGIGAPEAQKRAKHGKVLALRLSAPQVPHRHAWHRAPRRHI